MTTRKKIGILLIVGPFILLFTVLVLYAISSFAVSSAAEARAAEPTTVAVDLEQGLEPVEGAPGATVRDESGQVIFEATEGSQEVTLQSTVGNLINVVLGLVGIIAILGIIFGVPVGIYLVATPGKKTKK